MYADTLLGMEEGQTALRLQIEDMLEASEGEITPEIEAMLDAELKTEEEISHKLDSYAYLMAGIGKEVELLNERMKALKAKRDGKQRTIDAMKERLRIFLTGRGIRKIEGDYFTIALQRNGGVRPLIIEDGTKAEGVPSQFQCITTTIDTSAVRAFLEGQGEDGNDQALGWAKLGERGESVRIR